MSIHKVSTSDITGQFDEVFTDVSEDGKAYFITEKGKAKAVLVNVDRYNAWMDALESFGESSDDDDNLVASVLRQAASA